LNADRADLSVAPAKPASLVASSIKTGLSGLGFRGGPKNYFASLPQMWLIVSMNRRTAAGATLFTADLAVSSKTILRRRGYDPERRPTRIEWHREHRLGSLIANARTLGGSSERRTPKVNDDAYSRTS
jgi:hypothetical protein